jgi:hypothetical protein
MACRRLYFGLSLRGRGLPLAILASSRSTSSGVISATLRAPHSGSTELAQKRGPIAEAPRREIDRVLLEIAVDQFGHGWRIALLNALAEWIVAGIDFALEPLRLFARGGDRPSGPSADREAAFATGDAIAEKEAALAGAKDEDAKARDLVVIDEEVPVGIRHHRFHGAFGQMLLHARH